MFRKKDDIDLMLSQEKNVDNTAEAFCPEEVKEFAAAAALSKFFRTGFIVFAGLFFFLILQLGVMGLLMKFKVIQQGALFDSALILMMLALLFELLFLFAPRLLGLCWRCPECNHGFSYYVPQRYGSKLKNPDCLEQIQMQQIRFSRQKKGYLIFPSACPYCGHRFYAPEEREPVDIP